MEIEGGNVPIVSIGGVFTCQVNSGNLTSVTHPYFSTLPDRDNRQGRPNESPDSLKYRFCQALALLKLEAVC